MSSLEKIDSLYKNTISKLPQKEKIKYCEDLIDKAQLNLVRNKRHITAELENQLTILIFAAQAEISNIINTQKRKE